MKRRAFEQLKAPILQAMATLVAASALHASTTYTFRNGVNGYAGSADFSINTQYAESNGGNGVQWKGGSELGCYATTGPGAYTAKYLLKFANLAIPAGSQVVSAQLAL